MYYRVFGNVNGYSSNLHLQPGTMFLLEIQQATALQVPDHQINRHPLPFCEIILLSC